MHAQRIADRATRSQPGSFLHGDRPAARQPVFFAALRSGSSARLCEASIIYALAAHEAAEDEQGKLNLPDCKFECTDPNGGNGMCTPLPDIDDDMVQAVAWLGDVLASLASTGAPIEKATIMEKFSVADDPCDRSDTMVRQGRVGNTGKACRLAVALSTPLRKTVSNVHVRAEVAGAYFQDDGDHVVRFDAAGKRLALSFSEPVIHRNLGGQLHEIRVSTGARDRDHFGEVPWPVEAGLSRGAYLVVLSRAAQKLGRRILVEETHGTSHFSPWFIKGKRRRVYA